MATGQYIYTNITDSIHKVYNGALAKTLTEKAPSVARLQALGLVRRGAQVERLSWPTVQSGHGSASNIPDGGTLPSATYEKTKQAVLDFEIYIKMLRFGRKVRKGAGNIYEYFQSAEGRDMVASEMNRVMPQIARSIHTDIVNLSANAANKLTSLGSAIATDDNTYAGIDRSSFSYWAPYVNDNSGTDRSVTAALMDDMYTNLTENREAVITEIWAGATAWNAIRNLIGTTTAPVRNNDPRKLYGGATEILWEDIPVIRMPGMDANATFWFDFEPDSGDVELVFQHPEDFLFQPESTNSYDDRYSVAAHCQLRVGNTFRQGALLDIQ